MGRNIEIKARAADLRRLEEIAAALGGEGPVDIPQEDTFFLVPHGRLKLRRFADGTGELIQYDRPDTADPSPSDYVLSATSEPDTLREALARALGIRGVVRKVRRLYMIDRTRVHLDEVEGLGTFVELEVVLRDGESPAEGRRVAEELMSALHIREEDLIDEAYVDLLDQRNAPSPVSGDRDA